MPEFLTVDLPRNQLTAPGGMAYEFSIPPFARDCLLRGLDEIGLTMGMGNAIARGHHGKVA